MDEKKKQQLNKSLISDWDRRRALADITMLKAMRVLLTNNDLAAEIHVTGLEIGVSVNGRLIPVIDLEIHEIENYLEGLPNNYE